MPTDQEFINNVKRELKGRKLRPRDQMNWTELLIFVLVILGCYAIVHVTCH